MALTLHGTVSDNTITLDRKTATPLIINGDMQIAQRGTSATGLGNGDSGYHTCDRWNFQEFGAPSFVFTQTQSTDVPTGQGFANSLKVDCTTAQGSLASGDGLRIDQRIEGQNLQMLKKGTSSAEAVTISFWVKSDKTGTYIFELFDQDNARAISTAYTISSSDTWEKKVIPIPADTTGAFDNDNARSLDINWWVLAGTDYTSGTLQTSWVSNTNTNRAVGQVNLADSTSNNWYITGVQLEVGTFDDNSIPPFQFEDRATSLNRCHRYFYRVYSNNPYSVFSAGYSSSSTKHLSCFNFPTTMRVLPTCSSNGSFQVIEGGSSRSVTGVAFDGNSRSLDNARIDVTMSGGTTGNGGMLRAANDTDAYIEADAEL